MTKVLVIQFRINPALVERERVCIMREVSDKTEIDYISALDESLPWSEPVSILRGFQGVILGGSGDLDFDGGRAHDDEVRVISLQLVERLRPLFQYIFANDIPTLGICYGHQIIGAFAGAEVRCDSGQKKVCSHEVTFVIEKDKHLIFKDIPDSFFAHYGHKDVLDRVPEGALLVMRGGEKCQVTALQYKNNIYTVQFHPELTFRDMIDRIKNSPGYLPEGVVVEEIFKDDASSNGILRNFFTFVVTEQAGRPVVSRRLVG